MAQSIVSNTLIATAGRGLNVALGLLVVKLLTNYLGPEGYGDFGVLLSLGTILQLLADFGLYLQLTRLLGEKPEQRREIIGTIFSLRLVLLVIVFLVGIAIVFTVPSLRPLTIPFLGIALGLVFQSMSQLAMGIFQNRQIVWRATVGDLVGRGGQIISILVLGFLSVALSGMTAAFAVGAAVAWVVHHLMLPIRGVALRIDWPVWKDLLRSSWPLGAMLVLNAVYFRIDMVILSFYRPAVEVGWYSLAYRIIESALFFPAMFGGLLLPRLSEAKAHAAWPQLRHYLSQGLTLQLGIVGFVVATLSIEARSIILLIAEASFLPAAPLLVILSLALACMFFGNVFGFTMVALERQTMLLKMYGVLALANTVGNILAIPTYGAFAAAVITVLTELAATTISGYIIWKAIHYRVSLQSLGGVVVASVAAGALYWVLPPSWPVLIQIIFAGIGYVVTLVVTRAITRQQLSLLLHDPDAVV